MCKLKRVCIALLVVTIGFPIVQTYATEKSRQISESKIQKCAIRIQKVSSEIVPAHALDPIIFAQAKAIMRGLGYEVEESRSNSSDLSIEIEYNISPLSAVYSGAGNCFTGASISGDIIITRSGIPKSKRFKGREEVSAAIGSFCNRRPENAPFQEALDNSNLLTTMLDLITAMDNIPAIKKLVISLSVMPQNRSIQKRIIQIGKLSIPELLELLKSDRTSSEAKVSSIKILGEIGIDSDSVTDTIIHHLKFGEKGARLWSAHALGLLKTEKAVDHLAQVLKSENKWCYLREKAIWALGEIGYKGSVPVLKEVLYSQDTDCIPDGVPYALEKIGGHAVIKLILKCLDDERYMVQLNASFALQKLSGQNFGLQKEAWKKWWGENEYKFR